MDSVSYYLEKDPFFNTIYVKLIKGVDGEAKIFKADLLSIIYHRKWCTEVGEERVAELHIDDAVFWRLVPCTHCKPINWIRSITSRNSKIEPEVAAVERRERITNIMLAPAA